MTTTFDAAFETILAQEGGWKISNISGDKGGLTLAGISKAANPDWSGWHLYDSWEELQDPVSKQAMFDKIKLAVKYFYQQEFWHPLWCEQISQPALAQAVFSCGVNCGRSQAAKILQIAVGASPDGFMGPDTLNHVQPDTLPKFIAAWKNFYSRIIAANPSQEKFAKGWMARANSFLNSADKVA